MRHFLRRWRHPIYWRAHAYQLPTWYTVVQIATWAGLLACAIYVGYAYYHTRAIENYAAFVTRTQGLFKGCVEGRNSLGVTRLEDGLLYQELCSTYHKRIVQ